MCLCPLADLFNHEPAAAATFDFSAEEARFQLRTRCAWQKHEEIRITYGKLSNADLLQYYGFVLPSNPHDSLYLSIRDVAAHVVRAGIGSEADRLDRLSLLASMSPDRYVGLIDLHGSLLIDVGLI